LITFKQVSPRLGVNMKLDQPGRTVGKASYGRYYGRLNTNMFSAISPGSSRTNTFRWNAAIQDYDILFATVDPGANFSVDPGLTNQYTDQVSFGIERELFADFGVDATFVYKNEKDFIRVKDVRGVYATQSITDTFAGRTQTIDVYNLITPVSEQLFQVVNHGDLDHYYQALMVQANKRWSDGWTAQGSYVWERGSSYHRATPGASSQDFSSLGPSGFGADPNDLINAYGPLPTLSTHAFRISATYQAPYGIRVGTRYAYASGKPFGRVIRVTGLRQGVRNVIAERSGSYFVNASNNLQLRLEKEFGPHGRTRLRLAFDLLNILNSATELTVRNNSSTTGEALFGQSIQVEPPRRGIIGIRVEF
jgi:hypothetical protein